MGIHAWLCIHSRSAVRMRRAMAMTVSRPVSVSMIVTMTVLIPMLMRMIVAVAVAELMRMIVAFFMAVHMVAVNTISTMLVSVVMRMRQPLQPGAVSHPQGSGGDQRGRDQLQIRLALRRPPMATKIQAAHGDHPHNRCVRQSRRQAQQDRLSDRAAHGDDEGGHHGFGMPRLQSVQRPQGDGAGDKPPDATVALLQHLGKFIHSPDYKPACKPRVNQ